MAGAAGSSYSSQQQAEVPNLSAEQQLTPAEQQLTPAEQHLRQHFQRLREEADILTEAGRFQDAEAWFQKLFTQQERALGPEHPDTLGTMYYHATALLRAGREAEAEQKLRDELQLRQRVQGHEHPDTLTSVEHLGQSLLSDERAGEAEAMLTRLFEIQKRLKGPKHLDTLEAQTTLGRCLTKVAKSVTPEDAQQLKYEEARALLHEALQLMTQKVTTDQAEVITAEDRNLNDHQLMEILYGLSTCLMWMDRNAEAEPYTRMAIDLSTRLNGAQHPFTAARRRDLAGYCMVTDRYEEAEQLLRNSVYILEASHGATNDNSYTTMFVFGRCLAALGKHGKAEVIYKRALPAVRTALGEAHESTVYLMQLLASSLQAQGKQDEAAALLLDVLDLQ